MFGIMEEWRRDYMRCTYEGFDYRHIPQEYLNSNIPEGRGMIKWAPFKTMPEQYEKVAHMIDQQAKCHPPSFDDDTMLFIETQVQSNIGKEVVLRYWNDGFEVCLECRIEYIDMPTKRIIVSKGAEVIYVPFKHIYEVY